MRTSGKAFLIGQLRSAPYVRVTHAACTTKQISRIGPMDLGRTREHDGLATACRARGWGSPGGRTLGQLEGPRSPRPWERATTLSEDRALASTPGRAFGGCPALYPHCQLP